MKLNETLLLLALQLNQDPEELIAFAAEDTIGGWDMGEGGWPIGSLWSVEGQTLYALVRALRPERVVEIGGHRGCSAAHLAMALDVNGSGSLTSVDIESSAGDMLPESLSDLVENVTADGIAWLEAQDDESIDLIFEDSSHGAEMCAAVATLAKFKLRPGGVLVMHDAAHDFGYVADWVQVPSDVGETVRRGLTAALGGDYSVYRADPSDCGFAVYQKPLEAEEEKPKNELTTVDGETLEVVEADQPSGEWDAVALPVDTAEEKVKRDSDLTHSFEKLTKAELLEYAELHKIEVKSGTKAEIIAQIIEAQAIKTEG